MFLHVKFLSLLKSALLCDYMVICLSVFLEMWVVSTSILSSNQARSFLFFSFFLPAWLNIAIYFWIYFSYSLATGFFVATLPFIAELYIIQILSGFII